MKYLSTQEKEEITSLIKEFEKKSEAELVAVITQKSLSFSFFLSDLSKKKKVRENAIKIFHQYGLDKTKDKLGIMFFVSIKEKQVEILADDGIVKKIPNEFWQEIVDDFLNLVRHDEFAKGFKQAIEKSSNQLIAKFPIQTNSNNELSDEIIEI